MLNKVVFNIDVFSECEQSAIMQFVKIHNGKFDNNLVGSKYAINGLINSMCKVGVHLFEVNAEIIIN